MKRIRLVLAALAIVVASLAAFGGPAMADDWDWNDDYGGYWDYSAYALNDGFGGFDQEAQSGDVDQSFDFYGTGDNSNQTVGSQGVANTGNAQNQIGITQFGSEADDFEFEDVGSSIEVSPTNTTSSDQEVDQAASAYYRR